MSSQPSTGYLGGTQNRARGSAFPRVPSQLPRCATPDRNRDIVLVSSHVLVILTLSDTDVPKGVS